MEGITTPPKPADEEPMSPLTPHEEAATTEPLNPIPATNEVVVDGGGESKPMLFFHWLKAKFDSFKKPKDTPIATDALVKTEGGTDATAKVVESQGEGVVDIKVDPAIPSNEEGKDNKKPPVKKNKKDGENDDDGDGEDNDGENKKGKGLREEDGIVYDSEGNVVVIHGHIYMMMVRLFDKINPKIAGNLRYTTWKFKTDYVEEYKNWIEKRGSDNAPKLPRSWTHFLMLYDKCLYRYCPHWVRYFIYAGTWHVFPFAYGLNKAPKLIGQCSEDLVPWLTYTSYLSGGRIFFIGGIGAIRIRNRRWEGQVINYLFF
jgi:hypothetical protein